MARRTFSSLVKADSREPAITGGAKRRKSAFRLHEKHPSKSSRTRIYRTLIGRVDSSIRQTIKWLARFCNKGKIRRASCGRRLFAGARSMVVGNGHSGGGGASNECVRRRRIKARKERACCRPYQEGEGRRVEETRDGRGYNGGMGGV